MNQREMHHEMHKQMNQGEEWERPGWVLPVCVVAWIVAGVALLRVFYLIGVILRAR